MQYNRSNTFSVFQLVGQSKRPKFRDEKAIKMRKLWIMWFESKGLLRFFSSFCRSSATLTQGCEKRKLYWISFTVQYYPVLSSLSLEWFGAKVGLVVSFYILSQYLMKSIPGSVGPTLKGFVYTRFELLIFRNGFIVLAVFQLHYTEWNFYRSAHTLPESWEGVGVGSTRAHFRAN